MSSLLDRLALTVGLIKPIGFHTFWSAPGGCKLEVPELLSLVAGVCFWRHKCKCEDFWLFTDNEGRQFLESLGVLSLYDRVIPLEVPPEINPKIFWAAAKVWAYSQVPLPAVSMDFDAFVTAPFWKYRLPAHVMALNAEPRVWECYSKNREHFSEFTSGGLYDHLINDTVPYNAGVLALFDEELRELYTNVALRFMIEYSQSGKSGYPYVSYTKQGGSCYFEEMVYAEQKLLPVVAKFFNKRVTPITAFSQKLDHIVPNAYAKHLWNSKSTYEWNAQLREHFVQETMLALHEIACDKCWPIIQRIEDLPSKLVRDHNTGKLVYIRKQDQRYTKTY